MLLINVTHTQNIKPYWLGVVALEISKAMSYAKNQKPLNQADVNQDSFQGVTAKHTFLLKTTLQVFKQINRLNQLIPRRMKYIFMGSVLRGRYYIFISSPPLSFFFRMNLNYH